MNCPNCGSEKPMEGGADFFPEPDLRQMTISGYTFNPNELEVRDGVRGKAFPHSKCTDCGIVLSPAGAPWTGPADTGAS